jgi:hypothetical protein
MFVCICLTVPSITFEPSGIFSLNLVWVSCHLRANMVGARSCEASAKLSTFIVRLWLLFEVECKITKLWSNRIYFWYRCIRDYYTKLHKLVWRVIINIYTVCMIFFCQSTNMALVQIFEVMSDTFKVVEDCISGNYTYKCIPPVDLRVTYFAFYSVAENYF